MKASLIAIAASLVAAPAFAEEGAADGSERDTIVVTGQRELDDKTEVSGRLGLTIRETPAIVDVVTQADFQLQGVRSTIEAMNAAPGVTSGNLPGSIGSVSMRGFHRAVNYLYDGVRMANSDVGLRNWDSWAFERIEVIKGPASVTSGEGALAGAINFVPRRPKLGDTSGEVLASYGSFDSARLAADLNLPLVDTVAVRGDLSWSRSSGWIDDTDSRTFAASGSLVFKPSDRFSATLSADYFEDKFLTAYYGTPVVSRAIARNPSSAVSGSAGLVLDKAMRRTNFNLTDGNDHSDTTWLRARLEYALSDTLRLVGDSSYYDSYRFYRDADEYGFNPATGLINRGATLITHDHQFWSQRVHLAFDGRIGGMRNRFTAGFEHGELQVLLAEIVPPLRDAVRLVDRKQRDVEIIEQREAAFGHQALRREVQQVEFAGACTALDRLCLRPGECRVQEFGAHARFLQRRDLILHQRNQRRDDDAHARAQQRGHLVAERLAATGRHQHQRIAAGGDVCDDLRLIGAEISVAEDVAEDVGGAGEKLAHGVAGGS